MKGWKGPILHHTYTYMFVQELGRLDEDAVVYKLIGPAMIKQDLMEANTNVAKRLEYIQGEVKRITNKLADLEGRSKEQQQLVSPAFLNRTRGLAGAAARHKAAGTQKVVWRSSWGRDSLRNSGLVHLAWPDTVAAAPQHGNSPCYRTGCHTSQLQVDCDKRNGCMATACCACFVQILKLRAQEQQQPTAMPAA